MVIAAVIAILAIGGFALTKWETVDRPACSCEINLSPTVGPDKPRIIPVID